MEVYVARVLTGEAAPNSPPASLEALDASVPAKPRTRVLVLAVSRRIVGVDVELPSTGRDIHGLVNRWFTEAEKQQFAALPAALQPEAFLRGWTCKEAVLKALGTGVRDLQNVTVDLDPRLPPQVLECPGSMRWELECWKAGAADAAVCAALDRE